MNKLPSNENWEVKNGAWEIELEPRFMATLTAKSSQIIEDCRQKDKHIIQMPLSIYGAHEIFLDGKLVKTFGNKAGKGYAKKYQNAFIKCSELKDAKELTWVLYSPMYQQAKIKHFPKIHAQKSNDLYVNVDLKVSIGIFLVLFSISILLLFWRRTDQRRTLAAFGTALVFGILLTNSSHHWFTDHITALWQAKLTTSIKWVGTTLIFYTLYLDNYLPRRVFKSFLFYIIGLLSGIALFCNELSSLPTHLIFTGGFAQIVSIFALIGFIRDKRPKQLLSMLLLLGYMALDSNDMLMFLGVPTVSTLHFAVILMVTYQFVRINEEIQSVFVDRSMLKNKAQNLGQIVNNMQLVAHDIRRPVTLVKLFVNSIKRLDSRQDVQTFVEKYAQYINSSVEEVNTMLQDMISVNTHIAKQETTKSNVSLREVIEETINDVSNLEKTQVQDIQFTKEYSHTNQILAHKVSIKRVLTNLIHNAAVRMPKNGEIRISTQNRSGMIEVKLRNSGTFIPEEKRSQIFLPFKSGEEDTSRGLGLTICRQIVEDHKGSINVKSWKTEEGESYTEFTLILHSIAKMQDKFA